MRITFWSAFWALSGLLVSPAALGGVAINEVLFNPIDGEHGDTGLEWVELYNSSSAKEDLSGWQLYPDGIGYFTFPNGFQLPPGGYVLVALRRSGADTDILLHHESPAENMGNSSGSLALFSGEPRSKDTIKSFLRYHKPGSSERKTWESAAVETGIWQASTFIDISSINEGASVCLKQDGAAGGGAAAWAMGSNPTAGAANTCMGEGGPDLPPPDQDQELVASSTNTAPTYIVPRLSVEIEAPINGVVGASHRFGGRAFGSEMKPITGEARYLWNFGDGSVTEGPSVTHTFHFPGVYTTSLNVVSGEAIGSALFDVRVEKNYIHLSEAVPGSGGFIELENASSPMIDLTGWVIADDAGKQFSLPQGTMLRGHSLFLLPNITSGLLLSNAKGVSLRYGNLQNVESVLLLDYSGVLATARFGDAWRTAPPSPGVSQLDADKKQPALETRETLSQTPDLLVSRERAGAVPSQVIEKDIEPAKLATASALAAAADVGNAGLPLTAVLLGGSLLLGILGGVVFIFLRRREIHA